MLISCAFLTHAQRNSDPLIATPEQALTITEQLDNKNKIEVYPNPAVDFLLVQISNSELRDVKFEVRSLLGSEMHVQIEELGAGKYRFPVQDFSTGYYFIIVKDEATRFKKAFRFLKSN